jgi:hypothetical protein
MCTKIFTGFNTILENVTNRIGGVMVSVFASSAMFESRSGQTKNYDIGICCFSAKQSALKRSSTDWLPRNQDNVSEWDMTEYASGASQMKLKMKTHS